MEDFNPESPPSTEHQAQQHSSLPPYPEMIMDAIETLNEPSGLNKTAISRHIESAQPTLPPSHATLLSFHLNQMKQSGQLVMVKNNYMKPDPNSPPKRGRGRPPKPKEPSTLGAAVVSGPPRPRGRPPKLRDPSEPTKVKPAGTGRPRGRPPKKARTGDAPAPAQAQSAATGERRGRGRPPKAKQVVAPVGC